MKKIYTTLNTIEFYTLFLADATNKRRVTAVIIDVITLVFNALSYYFLKEFTVQR